jgi:hypothetical protein
VSCDSGREGYCGCEFFSDDHCNNPLGIIAVDGNNCMDGGVRSMYCKQTIKMPNQVLRELENATFVCDWHVPSRCHKNNAVAVVFCFNVVSVCEGGEEHRKRIIDDKLTAVVVLLE